MAEGMEKTYVKDIVNKEGLKSQEAKDAVPENFDFAKFDEMVENSFQQFLQSYKENNKLTENMNKDDVQALFNNWLDTIFIQLDEIKEMEIEKSIIVPTDFELINFETAKNLLDLQTEVEVQQRDATVQSEIVSVNGGDLNIHTFKDENGERVNPNKIAEIFNNKNFEKKDELLNLLKLGGIDNVKKFQRIIAGLNENGSEDDRGRSTLLGRFGVDGKFGGNTMKAFEDYVDNHETAIPQPASNNDGSQDVVQASVNVTGEQIPTTPTGNPANNPNENPERVTPTSDIDNFEFEMNKKEEIDETLAREIVQKEKEAGKHSIQLENLKKMSPEVATILAEFEGNLRFPALEELNPETLKAFISENSKCTLVKFSGGYIENHNGKFSITLDDGRTLTDVKDTDITDDICRSLAKKVDNNSGQPVQPTTQPGNNNQSSVSGNNNQNTNNGRPNPAQGEGRINIVESHEMNLSYIELENKLNEELQSIASNLPKIRVFSDGNKHNLYIPKILGDFRAFNVAHTPEMTPYITEQVNGEGVPCFIIPADIKIGLVKNIITNTLVLGDYEIKDGLINLQSNSTVIGHPENYNGNQNQPSLKITGYQINENTPEEGDGEGEEEQNVPQDSRNQYHNLENDQYGEISQEALASNYDAIIDYMEGQNNNNLIQAFQRLKINPNNIANTLAQILADNPTITKGNFKKEHISREAMDQLGRNSRWFVNEKSELIKILNEVPTDKLNQFINEMKVFNDIRQLNKTKRFIEMNQNKIKTNPFLVLSDFSRNGVLGRDGNETDNGLSHGGRTSEQAMYDNFLSYSNTETKGSHKEIVNGERTADLVQGFVSMIKSIGDGRYDDIENSFPDGAYTIENLGNYIIAHPETLELYQQTLNNLSYNPSVDISNIISHSRRQLIINNEMQNIESINTNRDSIKKRVDAQLGKDEEFNKRFSALSAEEQKNFIGRMAVRLDEGGLLPTIVKSFGIASKTNVTVDNLDKVNFERHVLKDDAGIGPRLSFGPIQDGAILHFDIPIVNLTGNFDLNHSAVENSVVHGVNPIYQLYTRLGANVGCGISFPTAAHPEWEGYLSAAAEAAIGGKVDYKKGIELSSSNFGNMLQNQIFKEPDFSNKESFKQKATQSIENILSSTDRESKNLRKFMTNNKQEMLNCIDNVSAMLDMLGAFDPSKKAEHKTILLNSIMKGIVEEVKNQNISELDGKTKLTRLGLFGQIGVGFDLKKLFEGDVKGAFGAGRSVGLEGTISSWNMLYLPDEQKYNYMDSSLKSGESIQSIGEGIKTSNIENMKQAITEALSENSIPNINVNSNDKGQIEISVTDEVLQRYEKKNIYELFNIYVNPDKKNNVAISEDGKKLVFGGNNLENFSVATRRYFNDFSVYLMIGGKGIDGCGNNKINDTTINEYNTQEHMNNIPGFEFKDIAPEFQDTTHPIDNLFESYNELNAIFSDIEMKLSSMDGYGNDGAYATFMNAAADANLDEKLDNSDYEAAFTALTNLLNGKLRDSCFDGLRGKLANATAEEKVMIVDRFKAIFSYNYNLTNTWALNSQLQNRGSRYKELYGYDKNESFPLTSNFDYRDAVKQRINSKGTFGRELNPNLIGMTAFYRLGKGNVGRSYMMTELGGTNVLGGETITITDANDLSLTKKWFIKNLEKSGTHKELLRASLSAKLKSILNVEELTLSDENLISLLQGEDIDIGDKKVKINSKYVFYLLGECANESIGMELGDITVRTKIESHEDEENVLEVGRDGQTLTKTTSINQDDVSGKVNVWGTGTGGRPTGGGTGGPSGGGTGHVD